MADNAAVPENDANAEADDDAVIEVEEFGYVVPTLSEGEREHWETWSDTWRGLGDGSIRRANAIPEALRGDHDIMVRAIETLENRDAVLQHADVRLPTRALQWPPQLLAPPVQRRSLLAALGLRRSRASGHLAR